MATTTTTATTAALRSPGVTPHPIFEMVSGFHQTAAIKAAVDLDLFTAIGEGAATVPALAVRCGASERGVRMLADYCAVHGLLTKAGHEYALAPVASAFLDKRSPQYLGTMFGFLTNPAMLRGYEDLTDTVRRGTVDPERNFAAGENAVWVEFARSMVPMAVPIANAVADILDIASAGPRRVLDIAAGHGMYGIALAARNPNVEVTAVDWPDVLAVASENARRLGVADRHTTIPGDAFAVDFGTGYDVALVTNFLHHFDAQSCADFVAKVAAALDSGGRIVIVDFVPNEDRVSPREAAAFVINMLAVTASGDVYTRSDLRGFLEAAGFGEPEFHQMPTPQTVTVASKN